MHGRVVRVRAPVDGLKEVQQAAAEGQGIANHPKRTYKKKGSSKSSGAKSLKNYRTRYKSTRKEGSAPESISLTNKNLKTISEALVAKMQYRGSIPAAEIANELAAEAVEEARRSCQDAGVPAEAWEAVLSSVEKNIRRRLYDALKVLVSLGVITKNGRNKMLTWSGVSHLHPRSRCKKNSSETRSASPSTASGEEAEFKKLQALRKRVNDKGKLIDQLSRQCRTLKQLCDRNIANYDEVQRSECIHLPFVLVETPVTSQINLLATNDAGLISFNFSDSFSVHDDGDIVRRLFDADSILTHEEETPDCERR